MKGTTAVATTTARVVDFSNVKEGGNFNKRRVPEGDYLAVITKCEDAETKKTKEFQYLFSIKLKNKHSDRVFPYYCQLSEASLWKLRNLAIAAGLNVPKKRMKFDPSKVVNKTIGITLVDADYEGKEQSEIAAVFPAAELVEGNIVEDDEDTPEDDDATEEVEEVEEEEEEEEEVEEEAEDEDDVTGDEYDGMDRAALKAALKVRDASFQAKKSQTDDDLRDLLRAGDVGAEPEEEDDEEDEPEPEPVVVKKAAKTAAKKTKKKAATVTDEELEELDIDDL